MKRTLSAGLVLSASLSAVFAGAQSLPAANPAAAMSGQTFPAGAAWEQAFSNFSDWSRSEGGGRVMALEPSLEGLRSIDLTSPRGRTEFDAISRRLPQGFERSLAALPEMAPEQQRTVLRVLAEARRPQEDLGLQVAKAEASAREMAGKLARRVGDDLKAVDGGGAAVNGEALSSPEPLAAGSDKRAAPQMGMRIPLTPSRSAAKEDSPRRSVRAWAGAVAAGAAASFAAASTAYAADLGTVTDWLRTAAAWLVDNFLPEAKMIAISAAGAIIAFWLSGKVKALAKILLDRLTKLPPEQKNFIVQTIGFSILSVGLSKTLNFMGVDWMVIGKAAAGGVAAVFGTMVLSFITKNPGIAANIPFSDLFSGIVMVFAPPFLVGDTIEIDIEGKKTRALVQEIGLNRTRMLVDLEGAKKEVLLSNSYIWGKTAIVLDSPSKTRPK